VEMITSPLFQGDDPPGSSADEGKRGPHVWDCSHYHPWQQRCPDM